MDATQLINDSILESDEDNEEERENRVKPIAKLRVLKNKHLPETEFPLYLGENVLGRDDNTCTLQLLASSVSKQHIAISISALRKRSGQDKVDMEALVWDLGSMNGTRKGHFKLTPHVRYALSEGDSLVVADIPCQYVRCDLDETAGQEVSRPSVNGESETAEGSHAANRLMVTSPHPEDANKTPSRSMGLSSEQTPTQPEGTLVPVSDSDSDGEQGGIINGWRNLVFESSSHISNPTCSTFLSPTNKVIPESEDESPITPFTENRAEKRADVSVGLRRPQMMADDRDKAMGRMREQERAASKQADGDSDTDAEAGDEPTTTPSAHPATCNAPAASGQVQFHMDSDTDVEEDGDGSDRSPTSEPHTSTAGDGPGGRHLDGARPSSADWGSDTDEELGAAPAGSAVADLEILSDSDTDLEDEEFPPSPLIAAETRSPTSLGDAGRIADAPDADGATADLVASSDTDAEEEEAGAGQECQGQKPPLATENTFGLPLASMPPQQKCSTPLAVPAVVEEMETQLFLSPFSDSFKAPAARPAALSCSDSPEEEEEDDEDFAIAETQSFVLESRDHKRSVAEEATQAFCIEPSFSSDEAAGRAASFHLGLSSSSHLKMPIAMQSTQAFASMDPDLNQEATQCYAAAPPSEASSAEDDSDPEATQPYTGRAGGGTRCAAGRPGNVCWEETQAYIPESHSDSEERERRTDVAATETLLMEPPTSPTPSGGEEPSHDLSMAETQPMAPDDDGDNEEIVPALRKRRAKHLRALEDEETQRFTSPRLSVADTQPVDDGGSAQDSDMGDASRKRLPRRAKGGQTRPGTSGVSSRSRRTGGAPVADEEQADTPTQPPNQQTRGKGNTRGRRGKVRPEVDTDEEEMEVGPVRRGRGRKSMQQQDMQDKKARKTDNALEKKRKEELEERERLRSEESDRIEKEGQDLLEKEKREKERIEQQRKDLEETERLERITAQREENERLEREEKERLEKERREKEEQKRKEEEKRLELEKFKREEKIRLEREEKERLEKERREKEELERKRKEEERQRLECEKAEREEKERLEREEKERLEKERQEKEEQKRLEIKCKMEEKQRLDREEKERLEKERREKEEQKRKEEEKRLELEKFKREEKIRLEREEKERLEKERREKEQQKRKEEEKRLELEKFKREEKIRLEREEKERLEKERQEKEQKSLEIKRKLEEKQRLQREKAEREEKERLDGEEKKRRGKEEQERLERKHKEEEERLAQEKERAERLERERLEIERQETEKQKRLERKRKEEEKKLERKKAKTKKKVEKEENEQRERREKELEREQQHEHAEQEEKERLERLEKERVEEERMNKEKQEAVERKVQANPLKSSSRGRRATRKSTAAPLPSEPDPASNTVAAAAVDDDDFPARRTRSRSNSSNSVSSERSGVSSMGTQGGRGRGRGVKRSSQQALETPTRASNRRRTVADSAPSLTPPGTPSRSNSTNSDVAGCSPAAQRRGRGGRGRGGRGRKVPETALVCSPESTQGHQSSAPKVAASGRRGSRVEGPTDRDDNVENQPRSTRGQKKNNKEPLPDPDTSAQSSGTPTPSRKRAAPVGRSPVGKTPRTSAGSPGAGGRLGDPREAYKVLFTGVMDEAGERIVTRLGGVLATSVTDMTYLVTDKVRRTVKFLCAVARGVPIVTPLWLEKCGKAGSFLSSTAFIVKDVEQEKKFNFCLQKSLKLASSQPLLQGFNIHVTKAVKPEPVHMKELICCSGGIFLPKMPSSHKAQTVVVSCEEDWALCRPALSASLPVVSAEFILTGILQHKIDLLSHALPAPNALPRASGGKR